ncbi:hypothetical protein QTP88_027326 [Uroleucon formosanum]
MQLKERFTSLNNVFKIFEVIQPNPLINLTNEQTYNSTNKLVEYYDSDLSNALAGQILLFRSCFKEEITKRISIKVIENPSLAKFSEILFPYVNQYGRKNILDGSQDDSNTLNLKTGPLFSPSSFYCGYGLVRNWKQSIMYSYDTPMTQDLLQQITEQLHNVGFIGFVLSNGKYIGKGVFEELVNLNSGQDYKLAHKFTKKHLLVEGILVTNISLKNVLIDIKNMNGLTYTITRKLNQDILENLFSFLKGMAGCASNNITASDFKCCLRWFILGKHSHSVFSENTNIEDGHKDKLLNDCKCITSDLFYNLKLSEEICNDQLETESHNTCLKETDIPELHFDLLKQFEVCIS